MPDLAEYVDPYSKIARVLLDNPVISYAERQWAKQAYNCIIRFGIESDEVIDYFRSNWKTDHNLAVRRFRIAFPGFALKHEVAMDIMHNGLLMNVIVREDD